MPLFVIKARSPLGDRQCDEHSRTNLNLEGFEPTTDRRLKLERNLGGITYIFGYIKRPYNIYSFLRSR